MRVTSSNLPNTKTINTSYKHNFTRQRVYDTVVTPPSPPPAPPAPAPVKQRIANPLLHTFKTSKAVDGEAARIFSCSFSKSYKTVNRDIGQRVNVDGENLTNLRFADDVALFNETTKQMENHLNNLNSESLKVGLKIHKGKTKYMTNHADSEDILIDQQKIEKVTEFKYLGQTTHLKDTTKEEIYVRIRAAWSCFGKKTRKYSRINNSPFHLKNK